MQELEEITKKTKDLEFLAHNNLVIENNLLQHAELDLFLFYGGDPSD